MTARLRASRLPLVGKHSLQYGLFSLCLMIASRLAIEPSLAWRDERTMIEHFGSSLVAVRLIAYLRKRTANQSVAAFEADAEVLSRSAIAAMAELRGNTGWRTVRRCCARIDRMPWAALQHHH